MTEMTPYVYYAAACLVLVLTFTICGIVRRFHLCHPYDKNAAYFYPAYKIVSLSYLAVWFQAPYLLHWHSADSWLLVRSFFIIYIPVISSLAFKSFFFGDRNRRRLRTALVGIPAMGVMTFLFILACRGGNVSEKNELITAIVIILSFSLTAYLLRVTLWLRQQIRDFMHNEYSDENDFPIKFASAIVFLPITSAIFAWVIFLCDSRAMTACFSIVTAIVGLAILLIILYPQRNGHMLMTDTTPSGSTEKTPSDDVLCSKTDVPERRLSNKRQAGSLPEHQKDRLEKQIRTLIHEKQLFLQPGLRRSQLSEQLGSNRTYLSVVFKERFGSFYYYINSLRIEYAIRYAEEHPDADCHEIALNSGFGSVKTYNRVKKAYESGELSTGKDK